MWCTHVPPKTILSARFTDENWAIPKRCCRTTRSIRKTYRFCTFIDKHGHAPSNIMLRDILEIICFWLMEQGTIEQLCKKTNHSNKTIVDWLNLCREVYSIAVASQSKFRGTLAVPVEIDESKFSKVLESIISDVYYWVINTYRISMS